MTTCIESMDFLILGRATFTGLDSCDLLVVASFSQNRAVERIALSKTKFDQIADATRNVRAFIESGSPSLKIGDFEDLGRSMYDLIFQGKIRELFSGATAASTFPLLPCEVTCEDSTLAGWPWEFLFNSSQPQFLCEEKHPISRNVLTLDRRVLPSNVQDKIRVLFALGVKQDDARITPREERQALEDVFQNFLADGSFELKFIELGAFDQIERQLDDNPCDILHFFGHAGYDTRKDEGYLQIDRSGKPLSLGAKLLGQMLHGRDISLVFLNACKTAVGSQTVGVARSSLAGGLHARGIPTVVGTQFSMPDNGAHFFSATFYNMLSTGKSVIESIHRARRAMNFSPDVNFFDWGIPVLYSSNPNGAVFAKPIAPRSEFDVEYESMSETAGLVSKLSMRSSNAPSPISIVTTALDSSREKAAVRVGLIDLDAKAGFLPALVEQANKAQNYYFFRVVYLPIPSGYTREIDGYTQTYVPSLASYLMKKREELAEDYLCCLTKNMIAGEEYWSFFASAQETGGAVSTVSTFDVRRYAEAAGTTFAKACLCLFLAMLLMGDDRWGLMPHERTYGCFFDLLMNRDDIVVGLKKMKFDHLACRHRIHDAKQLRSIDSLLALPNS